MFIQFNNPIVAKEPITLIFSFSERLITADLHQKNVIHRLGHLVWHGKRKDVLSISRSLKTIRSQIPKLFSLITIKLNNEQLQINLSQFSGQQYDIKAINLIIAALLQEGWIMESDAVRR